LHEGKKDLEYSKKERNNPLTEQKLFNRLEDFISIAGKGEKVDLTVVLNKRIFTRKFDSYTSGDPEDEIDMYILAADFLFVVAGEAMEVTKYYVSGIEGESLIATKNNLYVANERLKMDYKRLREAKIIFLEKYWD
jgi:hypothetical protein